MCVNRNRRDLSLTISLIQKKVSIECWTAKKKKKGKALVRIVKLKREYGETESKGEASTENIQKKKKIPAHYVLGNPGIEEFFLIRLCRP